MRFSSLNTGVSPRPVMPHRESGAVKDIRLVTLVGTKTAGIASDPSTENLLDDGGPLALRAAGQLSADHELINGIGASRPAAISRSLRTTCGRRRP